VSSLFFVRVAKRHLPENFGWCDGYSRRNGIHDVDFATERRIQKLSAEWYREVIARNAAV